LNLPNETYPWIYPVKRLVISERVGDWCRLPYDGHRKGCPNYDDPGHIDCPPRAPAVGEFFDLSAPLFLVHSQFNLANHILIMEQKHPEWSLKQCKCVLYWQKTSRKQLKERMLRACYLLNTHAYSIIPEAMGVNVYATARLSGLKLERIRNLTICRHVALIGRSKCGQIPMFEGGS